MDVVRVYTKLPAAKEPDMDRPFTLRRGLTLLDLAGQVHKDYHRGPEVRPRLGRGRPRRHRRSRATTCCTTRTSSSCTCDGRE